MSAAGSRSGSARVSRVGDGVTPSRTSVETNQTAGPRYSRRRLPHFERAWAIYATTFTMRSGRCLSPKARTIVLDSLRHFQSQRYELFAACVMSDHVHLLFQPWPKNNDDNGSIFFWPSDLMPSIKSFSAHKINELESKADLSGRRNSSIDMCGRIATCKRSFITCCAIHGIPEWPSRMKVIRGSGPSMTRRATKVRFGGTPKPARATRALPREANHD